MLRGQAVPRRPLCPTHRACRGRVRRTIRAAATDGPGATGHFDLARKDCLGTARNTTSKIWYTVANGVLSDVYAPTIDTTKVKPIHIASLITVGWAVTPLSTRLQDRVEGHLRRGPGLRACSSALEDRAA